MSSSRTRDAEGSAARMKVCADGQLNALRSGTERTVSMEAVGLTGTPSSCEENFPTAVAVLLDVVAGPDHLPADEELQEMLRGKLRILQADNTEVNTLFMELNAQLVAINSEDKVIYVTFKSFEEIWKFTTYYKTGFLGHCLEDLLFDQTFWLSSLEDEVTIQVSIGEETLKLFYKGILMQEGSWFASCSCKQMFDSSTSAGDLYLQRGEIAQFEPPFLGSGWTVLRLADGARGTAPRPALEPVSPFHQWFLRSCSENILVGDGKPSCEFPLQFASGVCEATQDYDSEGAGELSVACGDRIVILGFLASCFGWFTGRMEATGEVGLVRTSLVKPSAETLDSVDISLDGEEWMSSKRQEQEVIEESVAMLKKRSLNDTGLKYKLDVINYQDSEKKTSAVSLSRVAIDPVELKVDIQNILEQRADPPAAGVVTVNGTKDSDVPPAETPGPFTVHPIPEGNKNKEAFAPLFSFLESPEYREEFGGLYGLTPQLLASAMFEGHCDADQLIAFLSVARETARMKRLFWSQTRLCFLLGKLCAGRSKFSQARVYLEESLSVPRGGFTDQRLLTSIFSHLAAIYLLQKNTESFFCVTERLVALLLGLPDCLKSLQDDSPLKYMLKKAILSHNEEAESRACHLLARHHWIRAEEAQAVPYLERLLVLCGEAQRTWSFSPSRGYLSLGRFYSKLRLPRLCVSSARRASLDASVSLSDCLVCMLLVLDSVRTRGISTLPHMVPYLHRALALTKLQSEKIHWYNILNHHLTFSLCQLLHKHQMVGHAIRLMHDLIGGSPPTQFSSFSLAERNSALIWLAWLHVEDQQPLVALDILDCVLASLPEHCTTPQEGVVLNMRGVALRCVGDLRRAAESYEAAVDICQEYEDVANWAVAQSNLGLLCWKMGAKGLARRHLTQAVQLFSDLKEEEQDTNFITVLLVLGQHFVWQQQLHYGKVCYEWALLLAIRVNLLEFQLRATRHLCRLYGVECPDHTRSIVYSQHQVQLLTQLGDRGQEAEALVTISKLYLTQGTPRAFRAALDYTKSSLAIFIDLGFREKEAYGWLQAGKIYHLLGQTELVDIYVQAAQDVALATGDTGFILTFLEAAGDIFFDSSRDRGKAISYYRDRALPIAVKSGNTHTRLRLCNKLAEVMFRLSLHEEAVEFAQTALDISVMLGKHLNERVASHRLASLFHCLEMHEMAEHYYLKTLSLCPTPLQYDEEALYYVCVYQTLGDIMFYDLKDPFDAAGYYHLALAAAIDLGNKKSQLQLCTRLATIYHNFLVDRELSLFFYQRARLFATELNVRRVNISSDLHPNIPQQKNSRQ